MTRLIFKKRAELVSDRETQRFVACDHRLDALEHVLQRRRVHYLRRRIADFLHHNPDSATALVATLAASHVCGLADAWQRCDWPIQDAYNVPDAYRTRLAAEEISAALALLALQQPLILELEQDQFQKLARNTFPLRQIRDQHRPLSVFLC